MIDKNKIDFADGLACPIPKSDYDRVLLAHGGGGTLSHQLINKMFFSHFNNNLLNEQHDSAIFNIEKGKLAFTTDSYVVFAQVLDLMVTGGSDCHQQPVLIGSVDVPDYVAEQFGM